MCVTLNNTVLPLFAAAVLAVRWLSLQSTTVTLSLVPALEGGSTEVRDPVAKGEGGVSCWA